MNLSPHFTFDEAIFSSTAKRLGIVNTPPTEILDNMQAAGQHLELVRVLLSRPIHVDSWYRCRALNKAVNGAADSAHMQGWAIDFICPEYGTPLQIVHAIQAEPSIVFDQCIQEGDWVHLSFDPRLRGHIMTAHFDATGKATYTTGA